MTSLAEVYEGHVGEEASLRQLYAGVGLFLVGSLLVVAGIVVASTDLLGTAGVPAWQAWELAGLLAGLGLPAVFVGIFIVLPASRQVRAAAAVGASVAVLGVALFAHAFPSHWIGNTPNHAPLALFVYFIGAITTFWCLFIAVATFKQRNDPGGTVTLQVTRGGETTTVEVDRDAIDGDLSDVAGSVGGTASATDGGSVGVVGSTPDDHVETQTNVSDRTAGAVRSSEPSGPQPTSDGGVTEPGVRSPADDAEVMRAGADPSQATDTYCGNCEHFRYVQTSRGMRPFCELHDGVMDDMDACEQWEPNQLE